MRNPILKELRNKGIHILVFIIVLISFSFESTYDTQVAHTFLVALLVLFLGLEYMRLDLDIKIPLFSLLIKPKEHHRISNGVMFLTASIIALAVFDKEIALAVILMAIIGDSVASLFGKKYGTSLIFRNKTWAGFIAEIICNLIIAFIVLASSHSIYVILATAIVATLVETLTDELDDTLLIPICAGLAGQIVRFAF